MPGQTASSIPESIRLSIPDGHYLVFRYATVFRVNARRLDGLWAISPSSLTGG